MDKKSVLVILNEFRAALERANITVDKLVLFGSYANGNYHEDSDIDVAVVSRDFRDKTYWEKIDVLSDAIYQVFQPIEALAFTPEEWDQGDKIVLEFARKGEIVPVN